MTLIDAPAYDPRSDIRKRNVLTGAVIFIVLALVVGLGGYALGHGWFFSNLGAEHQVNRFFNALQAKDYAKAYGIYQNDADWQKHPEKYSSYPLNRFTEDWTTDSPVNAPITEHHVDISKTDGSGAFGSGIIVAVRVNGNHKIFMYIDRADGTMTWPAPHVLGY